MTDRDLANKRTSAEGNASVCRLFFFPKLLNNCYSIVKSAGIRLLAVIFFFFFNSTYAIWLKTRRVTGDWEERACFEDFQWIGSKVVKSNAI